MKKKSRIFLGLAAGTAAVGVSLWGLGQILYQRVLKTDKAEKRSGGDAESGQDISLFYRPVTCQSEDHLTLWGYYRPAEQGHRWAICVHGYRGKPERMHPYGQAYAKRGYSVLLPALRGHGASEGTYIGMGWPDRLDIVCWIKWILRKDPEAEIVLHGVSMGAATVLLAAGENLPPNVRAVVEDCGYTTAMKELSYVAEHQISPLLVPARILLSAETRLRAKYRLEDAAPLEAVKKTNLPILFMHGGKDDFVPSEMVYQLYEAAKGPKELYLTPEAGHAESARMAPERYWAKIDAFLQHHWQDAVEQQHEAGEE